MNFIKNAVCKVLYIGITFMAVVNITACTPFMEEQYNTYKLNHVRDIYKSITVIAGSYQTPPLVILDDEQVNAWTDGDNVTITTALINKVDNDDEVAMILAHELSHALQKHPGMPQGFMDSRYAEANADRMGGFLMLRAGYDLCKGRNVFLIFLNNWGEDPTEPTHPTNTYRYNLLSMPWCSQIGE